MRAHACTRALPDAAGLLLARPPCPQEDGSYACFSPMWLAPSFSEQDGRPEVPDTVSYMYQNCRQVRGCGDAATGALRAGLPRPALQAGWRLGTTSIAAAPAAPAAPAARLPQGVPVSTYFWSRPASLFGPSEFDLSRLRRWCQANYGVQYPLAPAPWMRYTFQDYTRAGRIIVSRILWGARRCGRRQNLPGGRRPPRPNNCALAPARSCPRPARPLQSSCTATCPHTCPPPRSLAQAATTPGAPAPCCARWAAACTP